ncbi:MAG: nitrite reductase small subunit NirD [Candidatus Thiodiazotropha sp. (ex. Lucinisca nassula)]|nr:nitrite reductase small subunit NirD [Candidatus Thiodiazotropha sp. (ex. Lucinisca nassula)]
MSNWIEIGYMHEIPRLGSRVIKAAQGNIAIFRNSNDEIFALGDKCPHKGGPISEGIVSGRTVTCPLHNWRIQLDNGIAVAPDEGCTNTYPVKIEGNLIYLELNS